MGPTTPAPAVPGASAGKARPDPRDMPRRSVLVARPLAVEVPDADSSAPAPDDGDVPA